jgi:L-fuconolactonase
MRYIDIHTHVISPDTAKYPLEPLGGVQSTWSRDRPTTVEQLLAAMDDAGVERAAVVQASTAYSYDNSYLADSLDAHGERLRGVGSIDFLADDAVQKLDYWVGERGLIGLRLFSTGSTMPEQGDWLDDPRCDPAWKWAEAHAVPVCLQMQSSGIPQLENVLARFPDLTIVLDHAARPVLAGGPPYPQAAILFALSRFERIFLKISSNTFLRTQDEEGGIRGLIDALVEHFGAQRIAWGTNFPATKGTMAELVSYAEQSLAHLPEADRRAIFSETALRIYPQLAQDG